MRRLAFTAVLVLAAALHAAPGRQIIGSEQDHSLATTEASDCEHFYKTTFTNFRAQISDQEQREFPLTGISKIKVTASDEGGVSIRGWNRPFARLIVCRYSVSQTKSQAIRLLGNIQVSSRGGEIVATGPVNDNTRAWWVDMILYVPRRATVDVRAASGGVAIRNMSGNVTAYATSGGISVAQSTGHYNINTNSGGITLERVSGSVDATSKQGAIALRLPADDVQTVEAMIADAGEIMCTARGCQGGQWANDHRRLRLGAGRPDIRLSTTAAPIMIGPVTF